MKNVTLSSDSSITISSINSNKLATFSNSSTPKWSTKEKLYLISMVMVNGDSNWSYICDELNRWMKSTSSSSNIDEQTNQINRTSHECLKQYKFMIKSFVLKNFYCDLKKIYNDLVNQRLNELKNLIIKNREQYNDLHKEIEQILSMDIKNFDELAQIWNSLKKNFNNQFKNDEANEANLNKNVQLLLYINEKKRLEEEERERLRLLLQEEEERKRKEEEEKELERQRLLKEQQEREKKEEDERKRQEQLILEQEKQRKLEEEKLKKEQEEATKASLNIKTESNDVILLSDVEMKGVEDLTKKTSSDEDEYASQSETQKKQKYNNSSVSVEWKPSVPNSEENAQSKININNPSETAEQTPAMMTGRTRRQQSLRLNPSNKNVTLLTNRNRLNISESNASSPSASSSSDHDLKNDETVNSNSEQTNSSSSSFSKLTTRSTSKLAAAASSSNNNNNNNNNKTKSNKIETTQQYNNNNNNNNDDAELIFTPLIKCDKEEDQQAKYQTISSNENEETKNSKSRKSISSIQTSKNKKSGVKQDEETPILVISNNEQQIDQQEEQTNDNSNNRSLRSKLRSNQQSQSQLQTNNINKRKSTTVTVVTAASSPASQSKDQGLMSIIKSEPVQISTSSTVSSSNFEDNEDNTANVPTTRSKSTQLQTNYTQESNTSLNKFEDEKAYKAWKKSIMMVLNNISCHKHATIFMQPVKDEIAPGYSAIILRPMDLTTVKKNIENGSIKSTSEFQRDIMLMFTNAFMYNSSNHDIHKITLEMYKEVLNDIEQLLNAQETMEDEITKPLRFKDIRSSTASDRGAETESKEDTNEILVNILMKSKKEAHNLIKDDLIETSSIKSSSSISTPLTSNSNSNSVTNKSTTNNKLETSSTKLNTVNKNNNNNSRKRKPSLSVSSSLNESIINQNNTSINSNQSSNTSPSQNNQQSITPNQPKSKRRKSGR